MSIEPTGKTRGLDMIERRNLPDWRVKSLIQGWFTEDQTSGQHGSTVIWPIPIEIDATWDIAIYYNIFNSNLALGENPRKQKPRVVQSAEVWYPWPLSRHTSGLKTSNLIEFTDSEAAKFFLFVQFFSHDANFEKSNGSSVISQGCAPGFLSGLGYTLPRLLV